ncbi:MAG: type II toxin-antitoxin system VapB family antitoxin [Cellvibrionales bacterium]|nr:type II toxin-antitoxin system VapB family antitoxin [Cellvibrionales bacterium]
MVKTKIFKSNTSQAVRLPKAVALPENIKEVDVVAVGNTRIISPKGSLWDEWFNEHQATSDFMKSRKQPRAQKRDSLDD